MRETNGVVTLTRKELLDLIDREARERLEMSGEEFITRFREGSLPDSPTVKDIGMLVKLGA